MTYPTHEAAVRRQFELWKAVPRQLPAGSARDPHRPDSSDFSREMAQLKVAACPPEELFGLQHNRLETQFYNPEKDLLYIFGTVRWSDRYGWHPYVRAASQSYPILLFHREVYLDSLSLGRPDPDA